MDPKEEERIKRRDKKKHQKKYGMQISNRSIKTVILPLLGKEPNDRKRNSK